MNTINGYFLMSTMDKAVGLLTIQADNKISVVIVPNGDYFEVLCHPEVRTEIKRKLIGFTM